MPWLTTTDVDAFLDRAGRFLERDVVANNVLLTEAHFWSRLSVPTAAVFGRWEADGQVAAAFVHLPDHPVICSRLSPSAVAGLPDAVPRAERLGVEATDVEAVSAAFAAQGRVLRRRSGATLLRLDTHQRSRARVDGHHRPADVGDLPTLRAWFALFQERNPADRSHVAFVVDQPLDDGGLLVWEAHGRRVAMASRTPRVAGMVRLGLAFQPDAGTAYAEAAFDAACAEASRVAGTVLVMSGSAEDVDALRTLGFVPVLERVVLQAV